MKKSIIRVIALLLTAIMALSLSACKKQSVPTEANGTDVPVITGSPDGEVTQGPTATPENSDAAVGTDYPVITDSPDGEVTAGPTATPEQQAGLPVYSDVPIVTSDPGGSVTAGPTATPTAEATPMNSTPNPSVTIAPMPVNTDRPVLTDSPSRTNPPSTQSPSMPTARPTAAPTGSSATNTPKPTATPKPTTAPAATQAPGTYIPTPETPNDFYAHYSVPAVDCTGMSEGSTFFWTFDIANENSALYAGIWLIEYDPEYVEPVDFSYTWSGGLIPIIEAMYEEGNETTDIPIFSCNPTYIGGTAPMCYGVPGRYYSVIVMSTTTFDHGGLQAAGSMVRLKYRVKKVPAQSAMQHDANGYYLPLNIGVISSYAMIDATHAVTHGTIDLTPGKLYFKR